MMKRWIASPSPLARGLRPQERRPALWRRWCSATLALLPVALVTLMALALADTRTPGAWHSAPQPPGLLAPNPGGTSAGEGYWVVKEPVPIPRWDSAVMAYDGSLYVLSGYSGGTSFRYNPATDTWTPLAPMSPVIDYPSDGCLGYNAQGEPVIVLFPDTMGANVIMAYNVAHDAWSQRPVPPPLPSDGLSYPDVASDPEHNVCYLTGGGLYPWSGTEQNTLYAYYPASNAAQQLPSFTTPRRVHASWFIPQWGEAGYVCIAGGGGGTPFSKLSSTQCYDIADGAWHEENGDLGSLPFQWWWGADALQEAGDTPYLWIMGGGVGGGDTNQATYFDSLLGSWTPGPHLPYAVYGMEGATLEDGLYVVGGRAQEVDRDYTQHYVPDPLPPCTEVPVAFDDFEGPGLPWSATGLWHPEAQAGTCGSLVAPFPSPTTAWYYGDQAYGCTYDTGAPNEGYLTLDASLPITGARYATFRFWSYEQTWCGDDNPNCPYDHRFLEVSYDEGATWTRLWRGLGAGAWTPVEVSTHVDPGDSLRLRFFFDSINDGDNDYLGWFLDDVQVTACLEGVEPELPHAGFEASQPACVAQPVTFTNTTTGTPPLTFQWAFGDGTGSTAIHPTHVYTAGGAYTVHLSATNPYGSDVASATLAITPTPTAAFTYSPAIPQPGQPVQFTDLSSGEPSTWDWDFSDGCGSSLQHPVHVFWEVGTYTVSLAAANACGWGAPAGGAVPVLEAIAGLAASNDGPTPLGQPTALTATVTAGSHVTFTWSLGDGSPPLAGATVSHTYAEIGAYPALVTASNPLGALSASTEVIVAQPVAGLAASNDSPTPLGSATTLTATLVAGDPVTFTWSLGDGSPLQRGQVVSHTYPARGGYTGTVTATNPLGQATARTLVVVVPPPSWQLYLPLVLRGSP